MTNVKITSSSTSSTALYAQLSAQNTSEKKTYPRTYPDQQKRRVPDDIRRSIGHFLNVDPNKISPAVFTYNDTRLDTENLSQESREKINEPHFSGLVSVDANTGAVGAWINPDNIRKNAALIGTEPGAYESMVIGQEVLHKALLFMHPSIDREVNELLGDAYMAVQNDEGILITFASAIGYQRGKNSEYRLIHQAVTSGLDSTLGQLGFRDALSGTSEAGFLSVLNRGLEDNPGRSLKDIFNAAAQDIFGRYKEKLPFKNSAEFGRALLHGVRDELVNQAQQNLQRLR